MTAKTKLPTIPDSYVPSNFREALEFCKFLAESDFVPKQYKNKPGDILACIQFGSERGIPPMQSLCNIKVINGNPSMYGDLLLAMVQRSGLMVHHKEYFEHHKDTKATIAAVCEVRRRSEDYVHTVRFSVDDAKRAQLLNKDGSWQLYPKRMLMWRARGFALRDKFADALMGLITVEEAIDMPGGGPAPAEVMEHLAERAQIEDVEETEGVNVNGSAQVSRAGESDAVRSDDAPDQLPTEAPSVVSEIELSMVRTMLARHPISDKVLDAWLTKQAGVSTLAELPSNRVNDLLQWLQDLGA